MKNLYKFLLGLIPLFAISAFVVSANAAGEVDTTFNAAAYGKNNGTVIKVVEQSDGKFIIGGAFKEVGGIANSAIARINPDGSVDTEFNPPDFFNGFGIGSTIHAIALQNNGKILVGGDIYGFNNTTRYGIFRLNQDGSLDGTFTNNGYLLPTIVYDIEVLLDDTFYAGGHFSFAGGLTDEVIKFDANGNAVLGVDLNFPVTDIEPIANGKLLVAQGNPNANQPGAIRRLNSNLTVDTAFTTVNADRSILSMEVLPNEQIIAVGAFSTVNGFSQGGITRINADGTPDLNFNLNNLGANTQINDVDIRSDGKILIAGFFANYNGITKNRFAQLNSDGTLDNTFQNTTQITLGTYEAFYSSSGNAFAGLNATVSFNTLLKFNSNGSVDENFDPKITRDGRVIKVEKQSDGKIYIAGEFRFVNGVPTKTIARLNADGSLDTSFVSHFNSFTNLNPVGNSFAVQPDGKILVAVGGSGSGVHRLNADGSLDNSFNVNFSDALDLTLLADGKILVAGFFSSATGQIARLNTNGTIDNTFTAATANGTIDNLTAQPDGKVLVGGAFTQVGGSIRGRIARYNADGTLDSSFNPPGGANDSVLDISFQSDGKVLLSGLFTALNGSSNQQRIGRLNSDGTLDTTFAQTTNAPIETIKQQPDGKILIGGYMSLVGNNQKTGFARLNADGSLDNTFTADAKGGVIDVDIQSNNTLLIGGEFTRLNGLSKVRVARLLNNPINSSTKFDFDGDGRADIGVYRSDNNIWYQLLGINYQFSDIKFGDSGDIVAPADYDGDGKSDLGIFRPSSGQWWYQSSMNNAQIAVSFGQIGDIPRPEDFDGDGKDDFILYRPSNSIWYRFGSTGITSIVQFGIAEDKPVVGDFDGDGKGDIAIYRPSSGDWWYQSSLDGQNKVIHWGNADDLPAPADYDGDGKTDFAVFRPTSGVWYISNSSGSAFTIVQFGLNGDKPIAADYDGDGKADIAVYRPSTGLWYLLQSTAGFGALQFGVEADIPLPNAFVP